MGADGHAAHEPQQDALPVGDVHDPEDAIHGAQPDGGRSGVLGDLRVRRLLGAAGDEPEGWLVAGNGVGEGDGRFATTPPLATYFVSLVAGLLSARSDSPMAPATCRWRRTSSTSR